MSRAAASPSPPDAVRTRLLAILAALLGIIILRMTRTVTMPVVAGLLVAALMWPVLEWLARFLPRALALLATVLLVVAVTLSLFWGIAMSAGAVGRRMSERRERLEELRQQVEALAGRFGVGEAAGTGSAVGGGATGAAGLVGSVGRRAASMAVSTFSGLAFMVAFMALALAEAREVRVRIRNRLQPDRADRLLSITREVAHAMQRYFVVKSITSAITGLATLLITVLFGLDLWYIWGLLAFLLEYVPTVGSVLAVVPPAVWAAIQFDGLVRPLALTAALTAMQLFLGNYVDPRIEGRYLLLSPFVVLVSIVFWAWLWGAGGALMGVPLTLAMTTAAKHFDGTRWVWALLTEEKGNGAHAVRRTP